MFSSITACSSYVLILRAIYLYTWYIDEMAVDVTALGGLLAALARGIIKGLLEQERLQRRVERRYEEDLLRLARYGNG